MKLLGKYKNGNYLVSIFDDGTKIRSNNLDYFEADTVENFDLKITNKCVFHKYKKPLINEKTREKILDNKGRPILVVDKDSPIIGNCAFCHENSGPNGEHGDIMNLKFLETLHSYCEIAIGGGNPLEHPDLIPFLEQCKERKFIPSMTINQVHFEDNFYMIKELIEKKLIYGLGISLVSPTDEFIDKVKQIPNAVIHIINGIISFSQLEKLKNNNLKILVLGYKEVRRGKDLYERAEKAIEESKAMFYKVLPMIINTKWFEVVSFDNLALKQLDVKRLLSEKEWQEFYMGDDGIDGEMTSSSLFVDAVTGLFAKNSCSMDRYPIMNTIEEMYQFLKTNKN